MVGTREALAGVPGVGGEQDQVVRSSKIRLQDDAGVAWELYWSSGYICFCHVVLIPHKSAPAFHASTFIFGTLSIKLLSLLRLGELCKAVY